jgi:hypothetical protein
MDIRELKYKASKTSQQMINFNEGIVFVAADWPELSSCDGNFTG